MKKLSTLLVLVTATVLLGWGFGSNDGNQDKDVSNSVNLENVVFDQSIQNVVVFNSDNPLAILFPQGELVNFPGQGAGGKDVSAITAPGTLYGFGCQANLGNWMGDDFVVPAGQTWKIDSIKFFSYQTGGSIGASTITGCRIAIRSTTITGALVAGDTAVNRLHKTYWEGASAPGIYRTTGTPPYASQTTRPIYHVVDTLNTTLSAGTYWVEVGFTGSLASGPWAPPRTILNTPATGNAQQRLAGVWSPAMDGANQQGLPFIIYGTNITGISNNNTGIPGSYNLKQNYPNPFNPSTKISFDLPKQDFVKISVYDMSGKEVETLLNRVVDAGSFTVDFDASKLSTGVYFYKMITSDFAATKKMILVK